MENNLLEIDKSLEILKLQLEDIDKGKDDKKKLNLYKGNNPPVELIVKKSVPLIFRMSKDKNHKRPHLHLDIGRNRHAVSICIESSEILAGNIENKYEKEVFNWIEINKVALKNIWDALQNAQQVDLEKLN